MKKFFSVFICLMLCLSFMTKVFAEDVSSDNGQLDESSEYVDDEDAGYEDEDEWDEGEDFDVNEGLDGVYSDDEATSDDFDTGVDDENPIPNEELLNDDANVENSQTSDIPIMLIASIAIMSLIVVLYKKNNLFNNGY